MAKASPQRATRRRRQLLAAAMTISGFGAVCAGIAMVYPPAAVIVGGVLLLIAGLFGVDVGRPGRS